jgi:hypothetical protein
MRNTQKPPRHLKNFPAIVDEIAAKRGLRQADRDLVAGRSPDRAKEQDHPPLGEAGDKALRAARPEDGVGLYLRRYLSGRRQRRRARPALLQQRGHGAASSGDLDCGRAGRACHPHSRSAGLAWFDQVSCSRQHHAVAAAAEIVELNPVENRLSNRIFKSYDDIPGHRCFAWNKLIDMPGKIISIGSRGWAYRS